MIRKRYYNILEQVETPGKQKRPPGHRLGTIVEWTRVGTLSGLREVDGKGRDGNGKLLLFEKKKTKLSRQYDVVAAFESDGMLESNEMVGHMRPVPGH